MEAIRDDILAAFAGAGLDDVDVRFVLSPAWTTDWMTEDGRRTLRDYGIAPPERRAAGPVLVQLGPPRLTCPQCGSTDTEELTRFGSRSCTSMWRCRSCREPFDHFRAH
jgi:ring-1,2-phenylacetyl-CoA epoxidase subunit PaaD